MANASNSTRGFTPASNPERGNNIWATKWAFIYVKRAKAKTVPYRTLGFPEYGMANASNFTRGFTPASNPERGNNIWETKLAFIYVKRAKAKKKHQRPAHTPRHSQLHLRRRLVHRVARKRLQHHRSVTHVCPEHDDRSPTMTKTNCVRTLQRHRCVLST